MYLVATRLTRDQKVSLAAKLLREIVSEPRHVRNERAFGKARALWTLAYLERKNGNEVGAEELQMKDRREGSA